MKPLQSMTGFGQSVSTDGAHVIHAEVRSVNNRFLKCVFKMSRNLMPFENEFEAVVRESVVRGSVTVTLVLKEADTRASYYINKAQVKEHLRVAGELAAELGVANPPSFETILALPGVVCPVEDDQGPDESAIDAVKTVLRAALKDLVQMRAKEGDGLKRDLLSTLDRIQANTKKIAARAPTVVPEYKEKLKKRLQRLLADVSDRVAVTDEMVLRECAMFADRADIAEELHRLESHFEQFRRIADSGDQAGKKLDFLIQELLRETNTIASKSADVEIAQAVVDVKCDVERMREQVQNVE